MASDHLLAAEDPPIHPLECREAFDSCSPQEKLYAYFMSRASYSGTRILLRQVSPESERIFDLIMKLSKACDGDWESLVKRNIIEAQALGHFLDYAAAFLDSIGNYRGYGDSKILPRLQPAAFCKLCSISEDTQQIYASVAHEIYAKNPEILGLPQNGGQSEYFPESPSIRKSEIEAVQDTLSTRGILLQNTRLRKRDEHGEINYELLLASAQRASSDTTPEKVQITNSSVDIHFTYGDHSTELGEVVKHISDASQYSRSHMQKTYLEESIRHFQSGDMQHHIDASIYWVKDKAATVETFLGFQESYRDPLGLRCEWEGLVAIQNRSETEKLSMLASRAEYFIGLLPWCKNESVVETGGLGPFESSVFVMPDFVSLQVLAFCTSNQYSGITGPNYRSVRSVHGRKNISLSNRLAAVHSNDEIPFLQADEVDQYKRLRHSTFNAIVAAHELIGHGCGKLLEQNNTGNYNFDHENPPISPLSGEPIKTWYTPGKIPKSVFGKIYNAFNECLAESIALVLMSEVELLDILCVTGDDRTGDEVLYNAYLQTIILALNGLASYNPTQKRWGQAHDQARFGILKKLLSSGPDLLKISTHQSNNKQDLTIQLSHTLVRTVAHEAISDLALHLHVFKSTADVTNGSTYFESLTAVDQQSLAWREAVIAQQHPRCLYIMGNTFLEGDKLVYKTYAPTREALVQSWVDRVV